MLPFKPSAIEIIDRTVLHLSAENLTTKQHCHFIEGDPAAILIVEFYGDTLRIRDGATTANDTRLKKDESWLCLSPLPFWKRI